jgi:LytS/YehU family sensor histidine kinase
LHQADSANHYFRQYIAMKDAMLNDQTKAKFAAYNYNQKIAFLRQEREMQQAKLAETSFHRNVLIAGIVGVLLLSVIVLRIFSLKRKQEKQQLQHALEVQRLESEKTRAELQHQASELEMQALRAQMNPHFIFNCLNAINHFILNHEAETASDYLTKFSRLIRMVLSLSQKTEVSLQEELDCLSLYIQLEQLRFQQHFQYTILGADAIDTESIYIPTMLLQPFVENAIWHGLMHKQGAGELTIEVALHDSALCCTITDNGIGRSEAAALKSKSAAHKKSMGMQITANRLQLLNDVTDNNLALKVIDLKKANGDSAGTKVVITIPVNVFQNPIPDPV